VPQLHLGHALPGCFGTAKYTHQNQYPSVWLMSESASVMPFPEPFRYSLIACKKSRCDYHCRDLVWYLNVSSVKVHTHTCIPEILLHDWRY
jgi:hypothetical protein